VRRGPVLVAAACIAADLLVVGAGQRGTRARVVSGRVSRYCLAHAECPVLASRRLRWPGKSVMPVWAERRAFWPSRFSRALLPAL
ncbi:MAG: universal stress protein, partial [Actinobacteria bacterium]|nr:universal stress protein [Actinomycetota bacterium]